MRTPKKPRSRSRLTRPRASKSEREIELMGHILDLEARLKLLEGRMSALEEKDNKLGPLPQTPAPFPSIPTWPQPTLPDWPTPDNTDDARCHVCHNRWKDMGLYVCNVPNCPSRIVYCSNSPHS